VERIDDSLDIRCATVREALHLCTGRMLDSKNCRAVRQRAVATADHDDE
jgi:hypothetical protein